MSDLLRKAKKSDIPRITEIWQAAFGDEKEYVDFFLKRRFDDVVTLVFEKDSTLISQLFLIPCVIKGLQGYYLYAAATDNAYRGQGAMSSLLRYSRELAAAENKDFIFLVPGTESLYSYYKRYGYKEAFYKNTVPMSDLSIGKVEQTFTEEKEDAVRFLCNVDNIVSWNEPSLCYGTEEFTSFRGRVVTSDTAVIMLGSDDAAVICKTEDFSHAVSLIYDLTKRNDFNIVTNASMGQRSVGGMILNLKNGTDFEDVFILFAKE